ncbi:hypothetical protein [Streptomyces sclerotialus]|uniref:hypothetical protein n=1 Tax=Streptomyces sclerotialus TaxID=1957 RepID=UPI000689BDF7
MTEPLYVSASSPLMSLLRLRMGARAGRALVFLAETGAERVEPPRGRSSWGHSRPSLRDVRSGHFPYAFWVSLAERTSWVDVRTRTGTSRYEVRWRVSDPVAVVRQRVTEEGAPQRIATHIAGHGSVPGRHDLFKQPPPAYGTVPITPYEQEHVMAEAGLTYRFLETPPEPVSAPARGALPPLPAAWGETHREAYGFYREVVAGGPVGLAALWLLHQPEQAKDVLEWTVAHKDLLTDEDDWERTLAATLKGLTEGERSLVGVRVADVLNELCVPQGAEVLQRLQGERHAGMNGTPREHR